MPAEVAAPTAPAAAPVNESAPAAEAAPAVCPPREKHSLLRRVAVLGVAFAGGWQIAEWAREAIPPVVSFLSNVAGTAWNFVCEAADMVAGAAVAVWNGAAQVLAAGDAFAHAHPYAAMGAALVVGAAVAWHARGEHDEHEAREGEAPDAAPRSDLSLEG